MTPYHISRNVRTWHTQRLVPVQNRERRPTTRESPCAKKRRIMKTNENVIAVFTGSCGRRLQLRSMTKRRHLQFTSVTPSLCASLGCTRCH